MAVVFIAFELASHLFFSSNYPAIMHDEEKDLNPGVERVETLPEDGAPPIKIIKHVKDADEAMKAFEGHEGEVLLLDESTNKRILRKIDLNILPVRGPPSGARKASVDEFVVTMRRLWVKLPGQYVHYAFLAYSC